MDVKKAIEKRQSTRKYESREVSYDLIMEIIDAARLAPSGSNSQPSRYFVVNDKKTIAKFRQERIFPQNFVYEAPTIIVCGAEPKKNYIDVESPDPSNAIGAIRDLSIASSYLMLRATELGLGTCYIGWVEAEKLKEILGIPKEILVPYVITVGYAADPQRVRSRLSMEEILLKGSQTD